MARPPRFRLIEDRDPHHRRVKFRLLPAIGDEPAIELLEAHPDGGATGPPVLFIHGAFGGAWIWNEVFLPLLVKQGRSVAALSLRGHGNSDGYERLRDWRLTDYLSDVRRVLAQLPEPPIVIAHSLGGLVAQLLLGKVEMQGLVLLASLPPEGLLFVGPRLALTEPRIWFEAVSGSLREAKGPIVAAGYEILFSEGLPRERLARYASLMTPESPRALADAHLPGAVLSAALCRVPTLVVRGDLDRLVWGPSTVRTALYHGGEHQTLGGTGHFLQLDLGAETLVERLLDWMARQGLDNGRSTLV